MRPNYKPEKDEGNNEYKLKLCNIRDEKIHKIATQMFYRVQEGDGEAIYTIGVKDNGSPDGITREELDETFTNLERACRENNFKITLIQEHELSNAGNLPDLYIAEYLIRENIDIEHININVAMIGNVDSGKSTTISLLVHNTPDNGRGLARQLVFNFPHEVKTGRTSSVSQQIVGFDSAGECVNDKMKKRTNTTLSSHHNTKSADWREIVQNSSKIITLYDLAGHAKYLKTTVSGMLSNNLDYICLILDANAKDITEYPMIREHMQLCVSMKIPFIVIITKIDSGSDRLQQTENSLLKFIKGGFIRRTPYFINGADDIMRILPDFKNCHIAPIFRVSNITLQGHSLLKQFMNLCPKINNTVIYENEPVEFSIKDKFLVDGIGVVYGGILHKGKIKAGDILYIGAFDDGSFKTLKVKSIEIKRNRLEEGQYAKCGNYITLNVKLPCDRKLINKNMIITSLENPKGIWKFVAEIYIRRSGHSTTIREGYSPVIYTSYFKQCVKFEKLISKYNRQLEETTINPDYIGLGDKAKIRMRFMYRPEYIKVGEKLWMMDGIYKIIGIVREVS